MRIAGKWILEVVDGRRDEVLRVRDKLSTAGLTKQDEVA